MDQCTDSETKRVLRAYRLGAISLSRAAELAGLSIRDMLICLKGGSVELNYDLEELERDLENIT